MTKKQLAKTIRKGQKLVKEVKWGFLEHDFMDNSPCGCALGAALAGKIGDGEEAIKVYEEGARQSVVYCGPFPVWFSKQLGISAKLANKINGEHAAGKMTTSQIADALEEGKL